MLEASLWFVIMDALERREPRSAMSTAIDLANVIVNTCR